MVNKLVMIQPRLNNYKDTPTRVWYCPECSSVKWLLEVAGNVVCAECHHVAVLHVTDPAAKPTPTFLGMIQWLFGKNKGE